jgi:hypothetical protein
MQELDDSLPYPPIAKRPPRDDESELGEGLRRLMPFCDDEQRASTATLLWDFAGEQWRLLFRVDARGDGIARRIGFRG